MMKVPQQSEPPTRNWLEQQWLHALLAMTFLTRLPLPCPAQVSPSDLRTSMGWYPLVGLGLGAVGWGIYLSACWLLPGQLPAAVLTIVFLEWCTGALHLDGLMDTADGVGSGRSRERMLEIMKDSRVGVMGVFAGIALMLLKVSLLAALPPTQAWLPIFVGAMAARALPSLNVALFRYARDTGTGSAFAHGRAGRVWLWALLFVAIVAVLLGYWPGLLLAGVAILTTIGVQWGIARKLGGLTGDVYGFGIEMAETVSLFMGCIFVRWIFI